MVALYDERQRIRLAVKPGMTGPMQVYGRADLTFEERLAMERDYLDNISVAGDLAILLAPPPRSCAARARTEHPQRFEKHMGRTICAESCSLA